MKPRSASLVRIPALSPYVVAFARATASSASSDDLDRSHGAERLDLREVGVLRHVGEQRRLEARPDGLAAREHARALRDGVVDARLHRRQRVRD